MVAESEHKNEVRVVEGKDKESVGEVDVLDSMIKESLATEHYKEKSLCNKLKK